MRVLFTLTDDAVERIADGLIQMHDEYDLHDWPYAIRAISELLYNNILNEYIVAHYLNNETFKVFERNYAQVTTHQLIDKFLPAEAFGELLENIDSMICDGNKLAVIANKLFHPNESIEYDDLIGVVAFIIHDMVFATLRGLYIGRYLPDIRTGNEAVNTMPITCVNYIQSRRRLIITKEE